MKKILCIILAAVMMIPVTVLANGQGDTQTPIVYVEGQGATLENEQGEIIYEGILENLPEDALTDMVKACMPSFINAYLTNTDEAWDEYNNALAENVYPLFEDLQPDDNGDFLNGTDVQWSWNDDTIEKIVKNAEKNGGYGLSGGTAFVFKWDWRRAPYENAQKLNDYIKDIKRITGCDKVNLEARCEGSNLVLAYLDKYKYADVKCVEFYVSSAYGVEYLGPLFSGKIRFTSESINRYKQDRLTLEDEALNTLLDATLKIATDTYGLDLAALGMPLIIDRFYENVGQRVLLNTYGRLPGIWAIVANEYFDDAKKMIFSGKEKEYADLIEKIDDYHDNVAVRIDSILKDAAENGGIRFAVFAKYGYQFLPVSDKNDYPADNCVLLEKATFGATCAKVNGSLSDEYLNTARQNGTDKYISPDNAVDCSTALFPDTTWVIKNSIHKDFPEIIHDFMLQFFRSGGTMTVFTDTESSPQYMIYNSENNTLKPMTSEDKDVAEPVVPVEKRDFKAEFIAFFKALFAFVANLFKGKL